MIMLLLLLGIMFYQNTHTYQSDVIKYETGSNYVMCSDSAGQCPEATKKTLKEVKREKSDKAIPASETNGKPKMTIPLGEINAALKGIKTHDFDTNQGVVTVLDNPSDKNIPIEDTGSIGNPEPQVEAGNISLDKILIPAPKKAITTEKPFAIDPAAYYESVNEKSLEAKLQEIENKTTSNSPGVISAEEIRFISDDNELRIDSSSMEIINRINRKYRDHKIRVTGFGMDENDAINMTLMTLEKIDLSLTLEDVKAVSDKEKRMVLIEVLNEI
jgi:hypothetical protein